MPESEKAILVGVTWTGPGGRLSEADLDELAELARTAGAEVVGLLAPRRERPDPAYFIGHGKVIELAGEVETRGAGLVIFDDELSPVQLRNLEERVGAKVIDRTGLILDIFAQRARTREAKLQVELAQLEYLLPRLGGRGTALSRLGGGIGTRGPGETKLEADKQRLRRRIFELRRELEEVKAQRVLMRQPRVRRRVAAVALVGYTNAGKSTLFNALTAGGVPAEDKLFATLDPTVHRLALPSKIEATLADTVGFIRKLPHQLVAAFRATLEEVVEADLLLHVLDAAAADLPARSAAVHGVLSELGLGDRAVLPVLNKIDLLPPQALAAICRTHPQAVAVSAMTGAGLGDLLAAMDGFFTARRRRVRLRLPFSAAAVLSRLHDAGTILGRKYGADGVEVLAELDAVEAERLRPYWMEEAE